RDAQTVRLHQQTARAPDPMRQLLHGSIHFAWTHELRWGGWRAFRDVGILTSGAHFPWEPFVTLARDSHATTACYWALRLDRQLVTARAPNAVEREPRDDEHQCAGEEGSR